MALDHPELRHLPVIPGLSASLEMDQENGVASLPRG